MIQKYSILNVADNSGVKKVKCIHLYQGYRRRYANIGDIIKVSIQSLSSNKNQKIVKGGIMRALIVTSKTRQKRKSGYSCSYLSNKVVLLKDKTNKFLGNRVLTPTLISFRKTRFLRLLTISAGKLF